MKAVLMHGFGDSSVLRVGDAQMPHLGATEVLVRVHASALNRADLLQRRGLYPPPKGASEILGLEISGEVADVGGDVSGFAKGERVCALLPGGGYAEYAAVPQGMLMRIPDTLSYEEAAAIPEVFLTAYLNLFTLGGLSSGHQVLVHAGASGVGTAAIQLIRDAGGRAMVTAGSTAKIDYCVQLGASGGFDYHKGSFAPWVTEQTNGRGVDIILDFVGAPYFEDNVTSLAIGGKLIVIGTMGGSKVNELNLGTLLARRLQVIGTSLRTRSKQEKESLTRAFWTYASARFGDGTLRPVIDSVFELDQVRQAHEYMESNRNIGKIVLRMG